MFMSEHCYNKQKDKITYLIIRRIAYMLSNSLNASLTVQFNEAQISSKSILKLLPQNKTCLRYNNHWMMLLRKIIYIYSDFMCIPDVVLKLDTALPHSLRSRYFPD
jgi:hypothetical protein